MSAPGSTASLRRPALIVRDPAQRVLAGVAAATGKRLGVDAMFVRVAFGVLALAGGAGVLLYLLLWAVTGEQAGGDVRPAPSANLHRAVAFGFQVLGALLVLRAVGLWLGDPLVWPLALAALGACVLWARSDDAGRERWNLAAAEQPFDALLSEKVSLPRRLVGGALALSGLLALLAANVNLSQLGGALVAFMVAVTGLTVLLGPALWRLVQQATTERRERIRADERAEIGAHLHDSVLHTLALIQRSDSPQEMATLARSQERELRTWLQGRSTASDHQTLQAALEHVAARVEAAEHVAVDLVVVGDTDVDGQIEALVAAIGEAATNAAKHSGAADLSIYAEVEPAVVTAYVRDEGRGFVPGEVPADRRGIAHSIRGRIERHGGTVRVDSEPGEGTEITLTLPRRQP